MPRHEPDEETPTEPTDLAELIRAKLRDKAGDAAAAPTGGPAPRGGGKGKAARGGQNGSTARRYAFRRS